MSRIYTITILSILLCSCIAQINERSATSYLEKDVVCGIDESIVDEKAKLLPNGWITKPYSSEYWQQYWNHSIYYLGNSRFERERRMGYAGQSGKTLILYALKQRREVGLPDVFPEEKNKEFLAALYREADSNNLTSCEILGHRSPQCHLSPAQHPGGPAFQRPCGAPN